MRIVSLICSILSIVSLTVNANDQAHHSELILSTPDQVATLTSEPSDLVGGLIDPMSGQLSLRQRDLVVKGAQELELSRVYIATEIPSSFPYHKEYQEEYDKQYLFEHLKENYRGWQFLPHLKITLDVTDMQVRLSEPSGTILDFQLSGSDATLSTPPYAITNTQGDRPSGKYDLRNTRISYDGNQITVNAADGTVRLYMKNELIQNFHLFFLQKEILPNGKVIRYNYDDHFHLTLIESLDPKEQHVYASIALSGSPHDGDCQFTASNGVTLNYGYQKRSTIVKIKEKIKGGHSKSEYSFIYPPILTSVSGPLYRNEGIDYNDHFLLNSFSGKDQLFKAEHHSFGNSPHFRIHKLLLPNGPSNTFHPAFELNYQLPIAGHSEGSTYVKNSDGTATNYLFSKDFLLTAIHYLGQDGALARQKCFSWNEKNWLKSLEIKDGNGDLLYCKSYEYDNFGNPVVEVFEGDLKGEKRMETFFIKREFSQDGRHLLLKEEDENGKIVCFSYLPNTNLVTAKLTMDRDLVLVRELFVYDDCHNLIRKVVDDGEVATVRKITNYTLRQHAPFLHMPEMVEELYEEGGAQKLLSRTHLIYDHYGNIAQEEHFGSDDQLAYVIHKEYNERGDLLSVTSPSGQKMTYGYDSRGSCISSTTPSGKAHKSMRYDAAKHLIEEIESSAEISHTTSSEYDLQGRLVKCSDAFGNMTHYTYDPIVSQVVKTEMPAIASTQGEPLLISTSATYDVFGRKLTETGENGATTFYRYNAYGSPVEIIYPNGSKELFSYEKDGSLASKTGRDGLTIQYKYDCLGRILSKTYGDNLAQESFVYSSFGLLSETDKEGFTKSYSYDGAGRKIGEEFAGRRVEYSYDALGRIATICKHNDTNTLFIRYERDLDGRVVVESKTDESGNTLHKISYAYDPDGNRSAIIKEINGQQAIESFTYDPFHRLVEHRDAFHHVTKHVYKEDQLNALGQRVLEYSVIDPRNVITIETKDAFGRTVKKEVRSDDKTLSCSEMFYDPQGNLAYQKEHLYQDGELQGSQITHYTYTSMNQVESETHAWGTEQPQIRRFEYTPCGKLAMQTLPSQVILHYEYNPLGFLSHLYSSEGTIEHSFEYDRMGRLKYASDDNQKIVIRRELDAFGNILEETFPHDLFVKCQYDAFNRLISLNTDDGDVFYKYDPVYMREVLRVSDFGRKLYRHNYETYDLSGNLQSEKLIGSLGQVVYTTDLKGQKASISSPYFSQICTYDEVGNLIRSVTNETEHHYSYDGLSHPVSENDSNYKFDSLGNRIQKDGKVATLNELGQLLSFDDTVCAYDLNGNQILKQTPYETYEFTYDALGRLVQAVSEKRKLIFSYDALGRCINKLTYKMASYGWREIGDEHFFYFGQHEIGASTFVFRPKNYKVLGRGLEVGAPTTVGVEVEGVMFAPIQDAQGNIAAVIGLIKKEISSYEYSVLGEELNKQDEYFFNPWRFGSNRFDEDFGLTYVSGKGYYDAELGRWVSRNPAGWMDLYLVHQLAAGE